MENMKTSAAEIHTTAINFTTTQRGGPAFFPIKITAGYI